MKLYKTKAGIVIEKEDKFYNVTGEAWDSFINDDLLYQKMEKLIQSLAAGGSELISDLLAPVGSNQELWACGVTYLRSKV